MQEKAKCNDFHSEHTSDCKAKLLKRIAKEAREITSLLPNLNRNDECSELDHSKLTL
jgi:hypothetical protein